MDDIIILLAITKTQDAFGVWHETPVRKEVYAQINSVTRAEFYQAGRNGLNPEFTATIFSGDYDGERTCIWQDHSYAIYRTYHVPGTDYLELYVQREGGANGQGNT